MNTSAIGHVCRNCERPRTRHKCRPLELGLAPRHCQAAHNLLPAGSRWRGELAWRVHNARAHAQGHQKAATLQNPKAAARPGSRGTRRVAGAAPGGGAALNALVACQSPAFQPSASALALLCQTGWALTAAGCRSGSRQRLYHRHCPTPGLFPRLPQRLQHSWTSIPHPAQAATTCNASPGACTW